MCGSDIFLGIIAILFPPLADPQSTRNTLFPSRTHPKRKPAYIPRRQKVWVKRGVCSADSLINIALCALGFLPGLLHAWYIISLYPEATYSPVPQDPEQGGSNAVTYHYVVQPGGQQQQQQRGQTGRQAAGYGTLSAAPSKQFPGQQQGTVAPFAQGGAGPSGAGGEEIPPSYQEAVKGDHKVQRTE
ncbi:hypothetical protein LTR50_006478 [Elasticomyces elasticus]|nr:hypothetical protein LTR50_006478 [Elasticomyces elasticus]